jgi:Flp pilus assembly protein TadG
MMSSQVLAAGRTEPRGQGLVEFALVLPIVVLLALALFDAGRLVIDFVTLTNASRVGARVAMVNQSNDGSCTTVRTFKCAVASHAVALDIAASSVDDVGISVAGVAADPTECAARGNCDVTVTVEHDFAMITPLIGSLIGPVTLSSSTTMPMERAFSSPSP